MTRIYILILLAALAALAGCGGGDEPDEPDDPYLERALVLCEPHGPLLSHSVGRGGRTVSATCDMGGGRIAYVHEPLLEVEPPSPPPPVIYHGPRA